MYYIQRYTVNPLLLVHNAMFAIINRLLEVLNLIFQNKQIKWNFIKKLLRNDCGIEWSACKTGLSVNQIRDWVSSKYRNMYAERSSSRRTGFRFQNSNERQTIRLKAWGKRIHLQFYFSNKDFYLQYNSCCQIKGNSDKYLF